MTRRALQYQMPLGDMPPAYETQDGMLLTGLERYFPSGCNTASDIRGCLASGSHVGLCLPDLTADGEAALMEWLHEQRDFYGDDVREFDGRAFIDQGAFGETSFATGKPVVVRPITRQDWRKRFAQVLKLAQVGGSRLHVVTPDRVADQHHTLDLLMDFQAEITGLWLLGVQLVVPVQKGPAYSMTEFRRLCEGIVGEGAIWGIPSKKDATSLEDLEAFARELPPGASIHFLGMGPHSPRYPEALRVVREACPGAVVWSDSVRLKSVAGQGRPLTEATRTAEREGAVNPRATAVQRVLMGDAYERVARARAMGWRDDE